MSITVTTSTGKKAVLSIASDGRSVRGNIGNAGGEKNVTFGVKQITEGLQSFMGISQVGNRVLTIKLSGADLQSAQALFAEAAANRKALADFEENYEIRRARVLSALNK